MNALQSSDEAQDRWVLHNVEEITISFWLKNHNLVIAEIANSA